MSILAMSSVVKAVESGGSNGQWAVRYEPALAARIIVADAKVPVIAEIVAGNLCSLDTAKTIYCMSWGAYQDMGFELYSELGWTRSVGEFLADPKAQDAAFAKWLGEHGLSPWWDDYGKDPALQTEFATRYNGPGAVVDYVARMNIEAKSLIRGA